MKPDDDRLMKILYYPASYTHSSHLPDTLHHREVWSDVLVNYWIIKTLQLKDVVTNWQPTDIITSLILSNWHNLPNVAHLLGGYILRSRLPGQGAALITDPQLLAFISLPLIHHITVNHSEKNLNTSAWGIAFILSLAVSLPEALLQRLLLCFPAKITLPSIQGARTPHHINLLKMAITYANNYP